MQEYIHCKNESARCQMRVAAIGASQPVAGSLMPKYLDRSFFTLPLDGLCVGHIFSFRGLWPVYTAGAA